jgi:heterodisulfide reductase subunit A-like polyferredoxin
MGPLFLKSITMNEIEILARLQEQDIKAFKMLVIEYSNDMTVLAYLLLCNREQAMKVVDDILFRLLDPVYIAGVSPPLDKHLFAEIRGACGY